MGRGHTQTGFPPRIHLFFKRIACVGLCGSVAHNVVFDCIYCIYQIQH